MAKTIKEMAEATFPTIGEEDKEALEALKYIGIECDNANEYNSVRLNQQDTYIMGANAVLKEIVDCFTHLSKDNPILLLEHIISTMMKLKGE